MSLVPSFVTCRDGKTYKGLEYRDESRDWFIVFDDDNPAELVIRKSSPLAREPQTILDGLGIPLYRDPQAERSAKTVRRRGFQLRARRRLLPRRQRGAFSDSPPV